MFKGIIEFLSAIEDDNIEYQVLNNCVLNSKATKHKDNEITFPTSHMSPCDVLNNTGKVGLVLWVDRDIYDRSAKKIKK